MTKSLESLDNKFTGLVIQYHDEKSEELSLLETGAGSFKVEDEVLKVEYFKDGVHTQKGYPLCGVKNYEIYYDPKIDSEE